MAARSGIAVLRSWIRIFAPLLFSNSSVQRQRSGGTREPPVRQMGPRPYLEACHRQQPASVSVAVDQWWCFTAAHGRRLLFNSGVVFSGKNSRRRE